MTARKPLLVLGLYLLLAGPMLAQVVQIDEEVVQKTEKTQKVEAKPALDAVQEDERTLAGVGVAAQGPALLDYLRKRTFPEANPKDLDKLLAELGDDAFTVRQAAFDRLAGMGAAATVGLKKAVNDPNTEVRLRVEELKRRIEAKAEPGVQAAAIRAIGRLKPAGAAEVLIGYLPFAGDQDLVDEIGKALGSVAAPGGMLDPALTKALADPLPLKRALAGEGLARSGVDRPAARKLLQDAEPTVRLRVALALIPGSDDALKKELLPTLVALVGVLNPDQLWPVEEVLVRLAGDEAPNVPLGNDPAGRKVALEAWQGWFAKAGEKVNLARLHEPEALLGRTLLVQQINNFQGGGIRQVGGEVQEIDAQGKTKWKFNLVTYPVDAQVIDAERVLLAEYQGGKVSERDFKGEVKWEKQVNGNPIGVQRLPNGNTFVVTQNRLFEINRKGDEVFNHQRPQHDVMRARKARNGEIVFITNAGHLHRMDAKEQKILKTFQVGHPATLFGTFDLLPNGHYLVPEYQQNRIVEYDAEGRQVRHVNTPMPNSALRLPNGHTLTASQNSRRVVEFDRTGREVWTHQCTGAVFNARRR